MARIYVCGKALARQLEAEAEEACAHINTREQNMDEQAERQGENEQVKSSLPTRHKLSRPSLESGMQEMQGYEVSGVRSEDGLESGLSATQQQLDKCTRDDSVHSYKVGQEKVWASRLMNSRFCPLCGKVENKRKDRFSKHLVNTHSKNSVVVDGLCVVVCTDSCIGDGREHGHYHCPCGQIQQRKSAMMKHTQKHHGKEVTQKKSVSLFTEAEMEGKVTSLEKSINQTPGSFNKTLKKSVSLFTEAEMEGMVTSLEKSINQTPGSFNKTLDQQGNVMDAVTANTNHFSWDRVASDMEGLGPVKRSAGEVRKQKQKWFCQVQRKAGTINNLRKKTGGSHASGLELPVLTMLEERALTLIRSTTCVKGKKGQITSRSGPGLSVNTASSALSSASGVDEHDELEPASYWQTPITTSSNTENMPFRNTLNSTPSNRSNNTGAQETPTARKKRKVTKSENKMSYAEGEVVKQMKISNELLASLLAVQQERLNLEQIRQEIYLREKNIKVTLMQSAEDPK